jgi:hypothetical protein
MRQADAAVPAAEPEVAPADAAAPTAEPEAAPADAAADGGKALMRQCQLPSLKWHRLMRQADAAADGGKESRAD